jgi:hypothetical protein
LPFLHLAGYRLAFAVSFLTPPAVWREPLQLQALRRKAYSEAPALASVVLDKSIELMSNFMFLASGLLVLLLGGLRATGQAAPPGSSWPPGAGLLALLPLSYLGLLWWESARWQPAATSVRGRFPARHLKDWAVSPAWQKTRRLISPLPAVGFGDPAAVSAGVVFPGV